MKKLLLIAGLLMSQLALAQNPQLEIKTNQGTITVELFADKAPKTTANFLKYANDGYYNGTIFHRVISNFMIQGGGMLPDMSEKKPSYPPIKNEAPDSSATGLKNVSGTLAMARTGDPHSATAQFFINVKDNGFLDYPGQDGWGYAVFGKVTKGIEVVMKIRNVQTGNAGYHQNVPVTPVIIESVTVVPEKATAEKTSSPEKK